MLAKLWKKVLLAICIIACLFNIMSKIVNRTSLEINLKSVKDGEGILNIFKNKEQGEEQESDVIDGVVNQETTTPESNTQNTVDTVEDQTVKATDFVVIY